MAISVRAVGSACVALFALTAAGLPPASGDPTPRLPTTTNTTNATIAQAIDPSPAYFILDDLAPTPPAEEVAEAPTTDTARDAAWLSADERCLAVAVYYESRGEPRAGQFAVAHVILNRARSGRFAGSACGVVRQAGQFSFAHRSFSPPASTDWTRAVAVARAAIAGEGAGHAQGALYFHASYVAPGWSRAEVATIGHHIFYR